MYELILGYFVVVGILFLYPLWRILSRAGLSPYFALVIFVPPPFGMVPIGVLLILALIAARPWPNIRTDSEARSER